MTEKYEPYSATGELYSFFLICLLLLIIILLDTAYLLGM